MTNLKLTKVEKALLRKAAQHEAGLIIVPATMRPSIRDGLIGRVLNERLIEALEDGAGHRLLPAGYRAVGATPPQSPAPMQDADAQVGGQADAEVDETSTPAETAVTPVGVDPDVPSRDAALRRPGTKQELILGLLARPEGASLAELNAATEWLPHTTRAALSRLRSGGRPLERSKRDDGVTVYRLLADQTARRGSGGLTPAATTRAADDGDAPESDSVAERDGSTPGEDASTTMAEDKPDGRDEDAPAPAIA